ncbi:MAG TPA: glycosyltransferase [Candidatus Limnocylindria bacterium]|nr:glycosyltransferase [Candidatus Limnocylindria bacterium]
MTTAGVEGRLMRVLHVIEAMHQGGAESLVIEHARHAGPGVEVLVAALNRGGPALEAARAHGARTFVLGGRGAPPRRIARLAALMRRERVVAVNGHNPTGALYATLAARLSGIPIVIRTEHSLHYPGRHSLLYRWLEPLMTVLTRRVVCVCQAVLHSHVSRLPWAARRFVNVANGISPAPHTRPREVLRRELELDPADRVVINVGSLTWQKAQHVLLEGFAETARTQPRARLWVVGEGPRRAELETLARTLGIAERVQFLGARGDVSELMVAADVFVLSSVREGLSVTLLEAMRAGRPAVVTGIGGNAEAVVDGETGRVVAVDDRAALARALGELLADPARAAMLGAAAERRWRVRFTAERMVRETEALYRERPDRTAAPAAWTGAGTEERHAAS